MGFTTLFNAVFINPEQVVRFLLCKHVESLKPSSDISKAVVGDDQPPLVVITERENLCTKTNRR